jgi:hypothetical protein
MANPIVASQADSCNLTDEELCQAIIDHHCGPQPNPEATQAYLAQLEARYPQAAQAYRTEVAALAKRAKTRAFDQAFSLGEANG